MALSRKSCRICLTETDFNIPLFGGYCGRTNMAHKIEACLEIEVKETDVVNTICHKCAANIENYYDFTMFVKKSQTKMPKSWSEETVNRMTADDLFSSLEIPIEKEPNPSGPLFSYISQPAAKATSFHVWKTSKTAESPQLKDGGVVRKFKQAKAICRSRDLFESPSQDAEEPEPKLMDRKLSPGDNIMKRIREQIFGESDS